jgi:hypothetical protein
VTTPDSATEHPTHLALFLGTYNVGLGHTVYTLAFYCSHLPRETDTVTTAPRDTTCTHCLHRYFAIKKQVAEEEGMDFVSDPRVTRRRLL